MKIRHTSEEEAKRVFDASGILWNSSKAQLLGSVGELRSAAENYYAVYTPDRSDWWRWPLSMLQEVEEDISICTERVNFQQGHLVKVRKLDLDEVQRLCSVPDTLPWEPNLQDEVEGVTWKPSMAQLLGSVGKVETRRKDSCRVSFGDSLVWWPLTMLEAPLCPQGHLLRLATAEFHICNGCGCGLSDTSAHCGECQQHFCSHCAQEEIGESIEVGARVRFLNNAADVCWNDCPGDSLPFLRGDLCRISELQGAWFRSGHLWAPVVAVEAYSDAPSDAGRSDVPPWKGQAFPEENETADVDYGEEWASTSTDLKEIPTPMFSLVARERLLLCESCWGSVPPHDMRCAMCHGTTALRPSYRERWQSQFGGAPGLEICPKEAWSGQDEAQESGQAILRKQMAAMVEELTRQRAEIQQLRWEKEELRRELERSHA